MQRFSSWLGFSSTPPTNMSKGSLRDASNVTRSVRKSRKVANIDEASMSDINSDPSQSESEDAILQYGSVDPPLKLTRTVNVEQESPHLKGRHTPQGPSNANKSEFVFPAEKEGDSLQRELKEIEMERDRVQQELDYTTQEKERISNELKKEREARRKASKELQRAKKEIEDMKGRTNSLCHELNATRRQANEYAVYSGRQNQELQATREQLQRAEVVHQQTREQLAERTAELKSAQLFIDAADSLSGADVISMTAALNAEILQSAALMADSLDFTDRRGKVPNEVLLKVQEKIGQNLTQALIDQRLADGKDVDPTLVQLALQVCLVCCSKTIITSWTLGGNDDRLLAIYSRIWNDEKQPVAGRWRSMTLMHATAVNIKGPDLALQMMIHAVIGILTVTGTNYHPLADQFQERLSAINTLCLRLRSSIGQYITSMEIHPFTIEPGLPFDPSQMEDTYAEERKANSTVLVVGGHVAGSTELGLISQVKDINGKVDTKVILKPKVVLCSALTKDG